MNEILKRIDEGKCLICNKDLGKLTPESMKELRRVNYMGKDAVICGNHHYEERV
jgi:hypothetical protein